MIITISGLPGSGKSSVAKALAGMLGYRHYSAGGYFRQMAKARGISINELSQRSLKDKSFDDHADNWQRLLGINEDNFVIDGWLSWLFIPDSFKVFIEADLDERARRAYNDKAGSRAETEMYASLADARAKLELRHQLNTKNWYEYYGMNYDDRGNYDMVVNSTKKNVDVIVAEIISEVKKRGLL